MDLCMVCKTPIEFSPENPQVNIAIRAGETVLLVTDSSTCFNKALTVFRKLTPESMFRDSMNTALQRKTIDEMTQDFKARIIEILEEEL